MPGMSINITPGSEKDKMLRKRLYHRYKLSVDKMRNKHLAYETAEERFTAYMPERDVDARRRILREQGKPQYTTLVLPYSYAILLTAHTYWTSVFMARNPIFQFEARHGETRGNVQAVEALLDYQVTVGDWLVPLYIWLMDVGKYGDGIIGSYWCEEKTPIAEIVEVDDLFLGVIPTGKKKKTKRTRMVTGYTGNKLFNVRPQHFFPDTRKPLHLFQEGEFAARYVVMGWNELRKGEANGYYINLNKLGKKGTSWSEFSDLGARNQEQPEPYASYGDDSDKAHQDSHAMVEMYVELIPNDWDLGSGKLPEKWVFLTDERFGVIVMARPLGALHNMYQFANLQLEPDGYSLTSRGMMEILEPLQYTMDWLVNTHFYNVRKTLNNQFIVDPSRVMMKDVLDPLPGGIYRMKPGAYGQDARTVMHQLPVQDVTQMHMQDSERMAVMMQRVSGVTDQIMGMMQAGGRKTAQEIRTSSGYGANRLKTQTEFFSAMGWSKLSRITLSNTQQYYDAERKYRMVGDLAAIGAQRERMITPDDIAGFYDFVPVDGTLPIDRYAQANLWRELFAQMRNFPELMMQYDTGGIFAWIAQLAGLKNLNQFKIQIMPDEQIQQGAAAGNLVTAGGYSESGDAGGPDAAFGGSAQQLGNVAEPGQVSGMGTTG